MFIYAKNLWVWLCYILEYSVISGRFWYGTLWYSLEQWIEFKKLVQWTAEVKDEAATRVQLLDQQPCPLLVEHSGKQPYGAWWSQTPLFPKEVHPQTGRKATSCSFWQLLKENSSSFYLWILILYAAWRAQNLILCGDTWDSCQLS